MRRHISDKWVLSGYLAQDYDPFSMCVLNSAFTGLRDAAVMPTEIWNLLMEIAISAYSHICHQNYVIAQYPNDAVRGPQQIFISYLLQPSRCQVWQAELSFAF